MTDKLIDIGTLCACMGPYPGDPFCPCEMRDRSLKSKRTSPTREDEERMMNHLQDVMKKRSTVE